VLNQCAGAAARTRDTYLSAQFWRLTPHRQEDGRCRRRALQDLGYQVTLKKLAA